MKVDKLYPLDHSLMMKIRGTVSEKLVNDKSEYSPVWNSLGAIAPGNSWNNLEIRLSDSQVFRIRAKYSFAGKVDVERGSEIPEGIELGYMVLDHCCLLLFKPNKKIELQPEILDLDGNSSYLCTPDKSRVFTLLDYTSSSLVTEF